MRQLGDLGRVDGRQRPDLQPARRAADDDVEARDEDEDEQHERDTRYTGTETSRR